MKLRVWAAIGLLAALALALRWEYLAGGRLNGIDAVGDRVWAVGQDGLFLSSDDNGDHWRIRTRFTNRTLLDVEFVNAAVALALAEGLVYRTTDAGLNWDSISVPGSSGRLAYLGGSVLMIDGDMRLLWSTDGGVTWAARDSGTDLYFFRDSSLGWKGGGSIGSTYIWRTTDGGRSWQSAGRPHPVWLYTLKLIAYADSMNGACNARLESGNPRIPPYYSWFFTTDGGATWNENGNTERGIAADVDGSGRLMLLGDGVVRILDSTVPLDPGTNVGGISARGSHAWVCGTGCHIWSSATGGESWELTRAGTGNAVRALAYADSTIGWAATEHAVVRTTDAGKSWRIAGGLHSPLAYAGGRGFFGLSNPASDTVFVSFDLVVMYGDVVPFYRGPMRIYRTVDGGASWDTVYACDPVSTCRWGASRIHFADSRHGWHVGSLGGANSIRTTDGGETWESLPALPAWDRNATPYGYSFRDSLAGIVTDSTGRVWHTSDGGVTWQDTVTGFSITDIEMTDEANGWATSGQGLLHTTDGGWGWELVPGMPTDLRAIDFSGPVGVAVGAGCAILRTTDGGVTWARDTTDFTSTLLDVFVLDSTHCWAAGENGLVLGSGSWALSVAEAKPAPRSPRLDVRPNPSRGEVRLRAAGAVRSWRVIDVTGKVVAEGGATDTDIDLSWLAPGVYIMRVQGSGVGDQGSSQKIVITR